MSSLSSSDAGYQVERHHRQLSVQTADPVLGREVEKGDGYGGLCVSARLGRFTIIRQLGVGGMGTVFAAYDEQLDRKVALKILHNPERGSHSHRDRTLREAKALARVRHPRVVSIYDVGTTNDQLYLAMEFVDGITLRAWLSAQTRSWCEILQIFIAAGEGLQAAHEAGVIHRDFKPDNVLVGKDGLPLVLDFGVARLGRQGPADGERIGEDPPDDSDFTYQGALSGTPGYMSPEQYGDEPVGSASDQFSFCAALYEALCGYLPFSGSTLQEHAVSVRGPLRPPPVETAFPPEVIRILSRGLSINPTDRFASMTELLQALREEQGQTREAGAGSRRNLLLALGPAAICACLLVQFASSRHGRILREAVGVSLCLVLLTLLTGLLNRRTLRVNRFHRQMYMQLLAAFVQILIHRLWLLTLPTVPFRQILITEMIIWAGATFTLACIPVPRLYFAPIIPLFGIIAGSVLEEVRRGPFLMLYLLSVGSILWAWHAESKQTK